MATAKERRLVGAHGRSRATFVYSCNLPVKMEVNEAEKIVISKPVPSRPTCSNFKSFSELLTCAINASPSNPCHEAPVTVIRPRTVRFKPAVNHVLVGVVSPESKLSGDFIHCTSEKVMKSEKSSNVVYKPIAKLVSRTTVSLLANMQRTNLVQEQESAETSCRVQKPNLVKNQSYLRQGSQSNSQSILGKEERIEPSKVTLGSIEKDQRSLSHLSIGDRPSYDGYNWRKYGQKQVKGSEYPRSYYKCTHPNCPVKKKVERSLEGQIAEIVYKGEHNHSKPQPLRRNSFDGQWQGNIGKESKNALHTNQPCDKQEGEIGMTETMNGIGSTTHSNYSSKVPTFIEGITTGASSLGMLTLDNSSGHSVDFVDGSNGLKGESDVHKSKRRKNENQSIEVGTQEPLSVIQNSVDSGIVKDGFRWRKYGQKVVKGNSYPRSYYKCTTLKCNVRKYVERTSDDPTAFVTTYEGKHNHEMPIKNKHSGGAKTSSKSDYIS